MTRSNGRAIPGTKSSRPSYGRPKRQPSWEPSSPYPANEEGRKLLKGRPSEEEIKAVLLASFQEVVARLAVLPGGTDAFSEQELNQKIMEANLSDLSDHLRISRGEAAAIIVGFFDDDGAPGTPLAKLREIADSP